MHLSEDSFRGERESLLGSSLASRMERKKKDLTSCKKWNKIFICSSLFFQWTPKSLNRTSAKNTSSSQNRITLGTQPYSRTARLATYSHPPQGLHVNLNSLVLLFLLHLGFYFPLWLFPPQFVEKDAILKPTQQDCLKLCNLKGLSLQG